MIADPLTKDLTPKLVNEYVANMGVLSLFDVLGRNSVYNSFYLTHSVFYCSQYMFILTGHVFLYLEDDVYITVITCVDSLKILDVYPKHVGYGPKVRTSIKLTKC